MDGTTEANGPLDRCRCPRTRPDKCGFPNRRVWLARIIWVAPRRCRVL